MEELFKLRTCIKEGRYADALLLVGEMEEMSRDDKINKIESFMEILLLHLIKQHTENRSTRSWEASVCNSVHQIVKMNKRRKTGGYYLTEEELREATEESYPLSLKLASLEGRLDEEVIAQKAQEETVKVEALELILETQNRR